MKSINLKSLIIIILVFSSANLIFSQDQILNKKITLELNDVSIKKALDEISEKSNIYFSYNSKVFRDMDNVNINAKEKAVKSLLTEIFNNKGVDFKVVNNQVVILKTTEPNLKPPVLEIKDNQGDNSNIEILNENKNTKKDTNTTQEEFASIIINTLPPNSINNNDSIDIEELDIPKKRDEIFQLSFVYPVGTHGYISKSKNFDISFNILGGSVGSVKMFELGGLYNIDANNVYGLQIGGLTNIVGGNINACQISGLANINGDDVNGLQISGLVNIVGEDINALQISGLGNLNGGKANGLQISGLVNIDDGECKGGQITGLANIVSKSCNGFQIAGIANLVEDSISAFQISGIINTTKNMDGAQITGIANISNRDVNGAQISGIINIAKKLNGFQLGIININDTIESGIPLGIVTIVNKNSFNQFEISTNEALNAIATYRMGAKKFYNSYSLGVSWFGNSFKWALGLGFGTRFNMKPTLTSDIELIAYTIHEDEIWTNELNLLNQLKYTVSTENIINNCELYAGLTYNVMVSEFFDTEENSFGSNIVPWTIYNKTKGETNVKMWPGITAGIRF